jgi:hypothetical protein
MSYINKLKTVERTTAVLPATTATPYFTVAGRVIITNIVGECTVVMDGTANDIKLISNPTVGADVDLCAALTITSDAEGTVYTVTGTLSDALIATTSGAVKSQADGILVTAGTIDLDATATDATGSTKWTVQYIALDAGSTVVAA